MLREQTENIVAVAHLAPPQCAPMQHDAVKAAGWSTPASIHTAWGCEQAKWLGILGARDCSTHPTLEEGDPLVYEIQYFMIL